MNDLYLLDLEAFKWTKISSNNSPSERCALGMLTIIYNIECLSMDKSMVANIINYYVRMYERKYNIIIPNIIHPIIQQFYGITYETHNINEMWDIKEHNGCILNINNISYIFILNCPDKSNAKAKALILSQYNNKV